MDIKFQYVYAQLCGTEKKRYGVSWPQTLACVIGVGED
jgi:hypothetical protein